jgi:hypothetical protein
MASSLHGRGVENEFKIVHTATWLDSPGVLQQGRPVTLTLRGPGSSVVLLLFGVEHQRLEIPGLDLPLLLASPIADRPFAIGAGGSTPYTFTLPVDPAWQHRTLLFQGASVRFPAGLVELTNLGDLHMR